MKTRTQELIVALEDSLVQEFRTLQSLIALTKEERLHLPTQSPATLMSLVEKKESVLDQLGLLEDSRRALTQELGASLGSPNQSSTLSDLIPQLDKPTADRLGRLNDGIVELVEQARDLNHGNQTLATVALDWLASAQAFLLSFYRPAEGYCPPGVVAAHDQMPKGYLDQRA